jgi:hypothetical protein
MRTWILLACGLMLAAAASAAPADGRFSEKLTDAERQACGLDRLTSDQVAALNALVHRDATVVLVSDGVSAPKRFSTRLFPDEFRSAGLDRLTPPQLARLDALVDASLGRVDPTATLTSAPASPPPTTEMTQPHPFPEIHGMVSLTYGFGGGTSFKEATTALYWVDPTHHLEIDVAYSELQGKSPYAREVLLP